MKTVAHVYLIVDTVALFSDSYSILKQGRCPAHIDLCVRVNKGLAIAKYD